MSNSETPHAYRTEAIHAWLAANRWGSVVPPSGTGKTFVAMRAIAETTASTLVVVPPSADMIEVFADLLEKLGDALAA